MWYSWRDKDLGMRIAGKQRIRNNCHWFHFFTLLYQIGENKFKFINIRPEIGKSNILSIFDSARRGGGDIETAAIFDWDSYKMGGHFYLLAIFEGSYPTRNTSDWRKVVRSRNIFKANSENYLERKGDSRYSQIPLLFSLIQGSSFERGK